MMKHIILIVIVCVCFSGIQAQSKLDEQLPVRGLAIAAPSPSGADSFLKSYYDKETYKKEESDAACLKQLIAEFKNLNQ